MLGYGTARLISHEPLYHALSRVFIAEAIRRRRAESTEVEGIALKVRQTTLGETKV